ncbi:hypothetical protein BM525_19510 (plasmid) [Alteromonas mediterranea]|uniref:Uncharacterized protein n=1 Tax=Alteromonas mediterranea TaxID=314275 RepID=A0AAC9NU43_9ALTE|nr:hypothetical protein [Alteromonas mediterranea]APD92072.1 hypothetical protein BM524_19315 [Alteromonas mediterranea]APD99926.1 hypothetical protein BM525_19510 [Alteromonas mediterranea]
MERYLKAYVQIDSPEYAASLVLARAAFLKKCLGMIEVGLFTEPELLAQRQGNDNLINQGLLKMGLGELCISSDKSSAKEYENVISEAQKLLLPDDEVGKSLFIIVSLSAGAHFIVNDEQLKCRFSDWDSSLELAVHDYWLNDEQRASIVRLS